MDLYVTITNENGKLLETVNIYQDGSDAEGAEEIRDWLKDNYSTEPESNGPIDRRELDDMIADGDPAVDVFSEGEDSSECPGCDHPMFDCHCIPLKLSGNINWEARDDQTREDNEANKGTPPEGHPVC